MRVLQVHNRYRISGGEDVVVKAESVLLQTNSNDCSLFEVTNRSIKGAVAKIKTAIKASYSRKYHKKLGQRIREFKPDIVHVHNFFPLLTPSIFDVFRKHGIPVVQTLHNYRTICPGAYLLRDGNVCEDCLKGSAYQSVIHRCYRDSRAGSLAVANMVQMQRKRNTWRDKIDHFIALTKFSKEKFIQAGFPAERIHVKPNFIQQDPGIGKYNGKYALYAGRISKEKGILTLLQAWRNIRGFPIKIVGDGLLMDDISYLKARYNLSNVLILGQKERNEVFQFIKNAKFILVPSEWYETFGLICAEAFACGKPVIASRLGSMTEIVEDGITGLHFEAGNAEDLANKIQWLIDNSNECHRMGNNARRIFLNKYTAAKNYEILMDIYEKALSNKKHS